MTLKLLNLKFIRSLNVGYRYLYCAEAAKQNNDSYNTYNSVLQICATLRYLFKIFVKTHYLVDEGRLCTTAV